MTSSAPSLARRERHALCDLALQLGPDAPTLCGDWDARDLVAHLLVRENNMVGAAGIAFSPMAGLTEKAMNRAEREPFPDMVDRLRDPALLTPYRLPGVERLANTLEFLVHHEDLRRAQLDWGPRTLPDADEEELWNAVRRGGRMFLRAARMPVVAHREGGSGESATLRGGDDPVVVTGRPAELVLFLFGRQRVADVTLDGPPEAVSRLRAAPLGF